MSTWVLTVARTRALDRRRGIQRRRTESLSDDAIVGRVGSSGEDVAAAAETAERRTVIKAALDTLPPEQREALELAYFGGLSQTEVAAKTGQPLGTVKTRMRLALRKLRETLSRWPDAEGANP